MDSGALSQSALTALTFIATPALLTSASCSLANSTITRILHIHDMLSDLNAQSDTSDLQAQEGPRMIAYANRVELQARLLIHALNTVHLALGSFSGATLVTLVGIAFFPLLGAKWYNGLAFLGVGLGTIGVACLIVGSVRLFQATHLSLANIHDEVNWLRLRHTHKG
ncbi:MAG: hypothetical protein JWL77_3182 [Chthonomonadaceae bacterium]|nr:hypothetical protein [Chthonomonadaceae bacterium]